MGVNEWGAQVAHGVPQPVRPWASGTPQKRADLEINSLQVHPRLG